MRVGILTGGGDAPGLNGIIEATATTLLKFGHEVIGISDGFEGVFQKQTVTLDSKSILHLHSQAGTFLGTSNKSGVTGKEKQFLENFGSFKLDGLIAIGGDGTFEGLKKVAGNLKIIGVPKTIDNDLAGTEITFGYDTACTVVAEAVEALRFTAEAHRRIMIVETMGRTSGWIALGGGLASYGDVILIPEQKVKRESLLERVKSIKAKGRRGMVMVVSEGFAFENEDATVAFKVAGSPQPERLGGIAEKLARWIEQESGWEARHVVLGHLQRSRPPTVTDRFLTLAMGVEAARMAHEGAWNQAVTYRQGQVGRAPLGDLMQPPRLVTTDHRWLKLAQSLGLFV